MLHAPPLPSRSCSLRELLPRLCPAPAPAPRPRRCVTVGSGGERRAQMLTCVDCQKSYRRQNSDSDWHVSRGLTPAIRCKECLTYRGTARAQGDDPDALFPLARDEVHYRELRNAYMAMHAAERGELLEKRREVKAAEVLLAGGKTAYRREGRKLVLKTTRAARKVAAAGAGTVKKEEGAAAPARTPRPPQPAPPSRPFRPATAMQRLGREDF